MTSLRIIANTAEHLQTVDEFVEIFLINDADIGARIELFYKTHLLILLRNITLVHRREFKIEIELRQMSHSML